MFEAYKADDIKRYYQIIIQDVKGWYTCKNKNYFKGSLNWNWFLSSKDELHLCDIKNGAYRPVKKFQ